MRHHATNWLLQNARVALGPDEAVPLDITVHNGRIRSLLPPGKDPESTDADTIDLKGCLILPGLINAHDHLEFSLFPMLGAGPYPSAKAWAEDVYRPAEQPIADHLRVPKRERLLWGAIKNLLGGVTTVCHHNPYEEIFGQDFPVRVVSRFGWAHSLAFGGDVKDHFRKTPDDWPFIIHVGEGTDDASRDEIHRLHEMGALDERTVCVHAVAVDEEGWALLEERGGSVVWCPSSNQFTLGRTLDRGLFERALPVALATDSAITAHVTLLEELRAAAEVSSLAPARLYSMVTETAARVLRLGDGEGCVREGGVADLIALRDCGESPCETLSQTTTEDLRLVMTGGQVGLVSQAVAEIFSPERVGRLHPLLVEGLGKFLIAVDVEVLARITAGALGPDSVVRLAGRRVFASLAVEGACCAGAAGEKSG